jgi:hypothetical protein
MKSVSKQEWEQLLKQNPSNDDLIYIIRYTDKKNEAGKQLLKQNPTNDDLYYIIKYTDKKNEAQLVLDNLQKESESIMDIIRKR